MKNTRMMESLFSRWMMTNRRRCLVLGHVAALVFSGRASAAEAPTPLRRTPYRLFWTATRTADHSPLISTSMPIRPGQTMTVVTDSLRATEEAPAFPQFTATLSAAKPSGVFELVTRVSLRETRRTKKGRWKRTRRNIGALVPTRVGETQVVSSSGDAVQVEARLERE